MKKETLCAARFMHYCVFAKVKVREREILLCLLLCLLLSDSLADALSLSLSLSLFLSLSLLNNE